MRRAAHLAVSLIAVMAAPVALAGGIQLDVVGEVSATIDGEATDRVVLSGTIGGEEGTTARLERMEMPVNRPDMWALNVAERDAQEP